MSKRKKDSLKWTKADRDSGQGKSSRCSSIRGSIRWPCCA